MKLLCVCTCVLVCRGEAAVWLMVCRFRNANVSSGAFVRNTVIRPPAPWVEPFAAPAPALIYFDVNRKVIWVPEGSWRERKWCVCLCVCDGLQYRGTPQGSQPGPEGWPREEGALVLREGFGKDYWETKMFSLWLKETLEMLSPKSPLVWGGCLAGKLKLHPNTFSLLSFELVFAIINMLYLLSEFWASNLL